MIILGISIVNGVNYIGLSYIIWFYYLKSSKIIDRQMGKKSKE